MRCYFALCFLLLLAAGCDVRTAQALPTPTRLVFPPTWTPSPTLTPPPPTATSTLVIQDTPVLSSTLAMTRTPAANVRRYPDVPNGKIGAWAETSSLPADQLAGLAPHLQLAIGPQALAARQLNRRLIVLSRLDAAPPDTLVSRAASLAPSYDGVLIEHSAANTLPAAEALLTALRAPLHERLLVASLYAWNDGAAYAAHTEDAQTLVKSVDGVCLCSFLRASDTPTQTFKSEVEWNKDIEALVELSRAPNTFTLVATPFAKLTADEAGRLQPWFGYALASFLLGANGTHAYFSFQGPFADTWMANYDWTSSLGLPLAGYYTNSGLYARQFQKGLVLVNPGNYTRDFALPRTYQILGGDLTTRPTLEPHTGMILLVAQ